MAAENDMGLPEKVRGDLEAAQDLLRQCAMVGFPLDELIDGGNKSEAAHYAESFLEFATT